MPYSVETQVERYLERLGGKYHITEQGKVLKEGWGNSEVNYYRISIVVNKWGYTFDFYQGLGVKTPPVLADLIYSLLSDSYISDYDVQEYLNEFTGENENDITHSEYLRISTLLESTYDNTLFLHILFSNRNLETFQRLLQDY